MVALMGAYSAVDAVIDAWVKSTGSTLFTEWAGEPARYFHVPGDPPFECFQISVDPPKEGRIVLLARAIDTNDNTEDHLEQTWEGEIAELDEMLRSALMTVEGWKRRPQQEPRPGYFRYREDGTPYP